MRYTKSKIEWTDFTWSPWWGCTKVSPGCHHCYAAAWAYYTRGIVYAKGRPRVRIKDWRKPVQLNRCAICLRCGEAGFNGSDDCRHCGRNFAPSQRRRVRLFPSMMDWLDDEVPVEWFADLLALIHATPNLDWQLLTKRPENWKLRMQLANGWLASNGDLENYERCPKMQAAFFLAGWLEGRSPANVWVGTSVEDQARADERLNLLRAIPAQRRFLSVEPLLGPVVLPNLRGIHWVIAGGESGPKARPMEEAWIRSVQDDCARAEVPFFFKQWGGTDKKAAGRQLAGKTFDAMPA